MKKNDLKSMVGCFVVVAGFYGMIDGVYRDKLGFVHCEKNEVWTGELVKPKDVVLCSLEEDIKKAKDSAKSYFMKEVQSLKSRLARHYKIDNEATLKSMLAYAKGWDSKLENM